MDKPKSRFIRLDAHTLAYLGDFISIFEKAIQQKARNIASQQQSSSNTTSHILVSKHYDL